MNHSLYALVVLFAATGAASSHGYAESASPAGKKLIEYGWGVPTLPYLAEHAPALEERPFDGIVFKLAGGSKVLEPQRDTGARFENDWEAAGQVTWGRFTDNFVLMHAASQQDWFSDEDWENIARRAARMAQIARQAGCVGVCFDPEPYGPNPWSYLKAAHKTTKTFTQYKDIARIRGTQFMQAIESEMPAPKVLTLFLHSVLSDLLQPMPDELREERLSRHRYGLLAPFLEGMLTGASSQTVFIDGNESAYYYTDARSYFEAYHTVTQRARYLVGPEHWQRYRDQVRMGQALYLDYYYDLRDNQALGAYLDPTEQDQWLEHNAYWALFTTDTYVWCYSENMNWWTDEGVPPGAERALRSARQRVDAGEPLSFDLPPAVATAAAQRKAAEETAGLVRRAVSIPRLPDGTPAPRLDGVPDDAAWRAAVPLEPFVPPQNQPGRVPAQTDVRLLYGTAGLYVSARCQYPSARPAPPTELFQIFLNPLGARDTLHRVTLEPNGSLRTDGDCAQFGQGASHHGTASWTAEALLPWQLFGISGHSPGLSVRGNVVRYHAHDGTISTWRSVEDNMEEPRSTGSWYFE